MNTAIIKNHQLFVIREEDGIEKEEMAASVLPLLNCPIEFSDDTIFDDIWRLIASEAAVLEVLFSGALGDYPLKPFIDSYNKGTDKQPDPNGMRELVLQWEDEIKTYKDVTYFVPSSHFGGYGKDAQDKNYDIDCASYGLDFILVRDLKNFPIKLKTTFQFKVKTLASGRYNMELVKECEKPWTVYDVLYTILDEISLQGLPDAQTKRLAELDQAIAKANDMVRDKFGGESTKDGD